MRFSCAVLIFLAVASNATAAPVSQDVLSSRDQNARGERETNMEAVEAARDRGAGRIVDPDTWELDRMEAYRDRRYVPGRDFQLYDQERDRALRLQARRQQAARRAAQQTDNEPADFSIVAGDETAAGGLSPLSMQLMDDQTTLESADRAFEQQRVQLDNAEARELEQLRQRLSREGRLDDLDRQAARIERDYVKWLNQARAEHDRVHQRLAGKAATQPATKPAR